MTACLLSPSDRRQSRCSFLPQHIIDRRRRQTPRFSSDLNKLIPPDQSHFVLSFRASSREVLFGLRDPAPRYGDGVHESGARYFSVSSPRIYTRSAVSIKCGRRKDLDVGTATRLGIVGDAISIGRAERGANVHWNDEILHKDLRKIADRKFSNDHQKCNRNRIWTKWEEGIAEVHKKSEWILSSSEVLRKLWLGNLGNRDCCHLSQMIYQGSSKSDENCEWK